MIIDQLPALATAGDNDEIAIEVGTTTYKIKKSDFLKEFMPKSGGEFTGNVTVGGVLDVTQRRCTALLSQAGWYRVMKLTGSNSYEANGAGGFIVDFNIVRNYETANNEAHKISLMATWGNIKFINEQSVSNAFGITKIRTTNSGSNLYVDVYYGLSTQNAVTVSFNVTCNGGDGIRFNSQPLTNVADSPSGETVQTEYTFAENTITDISSIFTLNTSGISGLTGKIHAIYDASSGLVHLNFSAYTGSATFGISTPIYTCSNSRYAPKATTYGNGMIRVDNGEWIPYEISIGITGNIFQRLTSDATRVYGQITYKV